MELSPDADTDEGKPQEVSFQAGRGVFDAAAVVEPGLDQQIDRRRWFRDPP